MLVKIIFLCIFLYIISITLQMIYRFIKSKRDKRNKDSIIENIDINIFKRILNRYIETLDGREFEYICEFALNNNGYKAKVTQASRDGGKDIIAKKDGETIFVECKRYATSNISNEQVLKLVGACTVNSVNHAIFITTSNYTNDAVNVYKNNTNSDFELELWYMEDILRLLTNIDRKYTLEHLGIYEEILSII